MQDGCALLYLAAKHKSDNVAALLIENGADVNCISDGETPLHVAGSEMVARTLVAKGADIQLKNKVKSMAMLRG